MMNQQPGSQELLDNVERQGIVVKENGNKVEITSGQEAFFALLAQDMFVIAQTYGKDIQEVHKIFYEVSCDREKLIKVLENDATVKRWQTLEDLALRHPEDTPSFQVVLDDKGSDEVIARKTFLEIQQN